MRWWFVVVLAVFTEPLLSKDVAQSEDYEDSLPVVRMEDGVQPRVTRGIPVKPGELPSVVALAIQKRSEDTTCTGTIIHEQYVLTSGTCVKGAEDIVVYIGCVQLDNCTETLHGKGIVHSNYKRVDHMIVNDIGLVHTTTKISATSRAILESPNLVGRDCVVVAFINAVEDSEVNRRLYKLPTRSVLPCTRHVTKDASNKFHVLCATIELGPDVAFEDSGGPLLCDDVQIGIVSHVVKFPGSDNQSTKVVSWVPVSEYADWIRTSSSDSVSILPNLMVLLSFYFAIFKIIEIV